MTDLIEDWNHSSHVSPRYEEDLKLARKYTGQGPRYTSYPTAPQFREDFPLDQFYHYQQSSDTQKNTPLSIYVHLPFCHDICYYCACNKIVTRDKNATTDYLRRLHTEIRMQSELLGPGRPVTQMHWGGGTPNYLDNAELTQLMHTLARHFCLLDQGSREYSIEIDPRTVRTDTFALLKGLGFNRISLGIQDFDPLVQKAINRIQPFRQIQPLVDSIRSLEFSSLSFDLIYGLPHQDRYSMTETLRKVISLQPDRIACYHYAHLPDRFTSQRSIDRLNLPEPEERLLMQQLISHSLQDAGYLHIGMDHYVLPDDDLALAQREGRLQRNFQGYSLSMAEDLLGLGVSAISQIGNFYLQNTRELDSYYSLIDKEQHPTSRGCKLSPEDQLRRHIIMCLISDLRLDIPTCNRQFGIDFSTKFEREIRACHDMAADGLLTISADEICISNLGRPFLRVICMLFDAYLEIAGRDSSGPQYSTTI
jgi:oxygen-independent coproporphyrinogen-3 oxidase